ncbi:hypothetical protein RHMOL_Rhmol01G0173600 [Rhododendron molle]|uniref:Uncharacterized protein n=1 Tax=Rhododendron molle TaxID=49168 RepID=A0ACC0Q3U7_RHOML|nr:hypothetical protein RHMOL_Rhmol01G0173600 [Rhododendron molle]
MNVLKINVDVAVCKSSNTIGTEALAIRNGLKLGTALMCPKVHIESDAEAIVRRCSDDQDPPADIAVVIHDCLVLKKSFTSLWF